MFTRRPIWDYCPAMRKNLASVVILGAAAALSFSDESPSMAADYPTTVGFHSDGIDVGKSKGPVEKVEVPAGKKNTKVEATLDKPAEVTVNGFKPKAIVTASVVIDGKKVVLPKLTVGKDGKLDTGALTFKTPGTYKVSYTSGGVTKTITVTVKKKK